MQFLIVLALLLVVVLVVSAPLRRSAHGGDESAARSRLRAERQLAELEAARDAKYREVRDAQLDHATGKLSDADHARLDRELRAEAIEILKALDRAQDAVARLDPVSPAEEPRGDSGVAATERASAESTRQRDRSPA